jgi:branched-chain amino acid transport system permease protein
MISINVLSLIIVGGVGSIPGVIVGALILVGLPEVLREFAEYRVLFYGALLVVMMLLRPEGFWPARRKLFDAEETEEGAAA